VKIKIIIALYWPSLDRQDGDDAFELFHNDCKSHNLNDYNLTLEL